MMNVITHKYVTMVFARIADTTINVPKDNTAVDMGALIPSVERVKKVIVFVMMMD